MDLKTRMGFGSGHSQLYMKVTTTDVDGTAYTFYWGTAHIVASGEGTIIGTEGGEFVTLDGILLPVTEGTPIYAGGPPVYPVIASWGEFSEEAGGFGRDSSASGEVLLIGGMISVSSDSAIRKTIDELLATIKFYDATVELYQWHAYEQTQELVWKGVISQIGPSRFSQQGVWVTELVMSPARKALSSTALGDIVTKVGFPKAPNASISAMVGRCYGVADNLLFSTANRNAPGWFNFPMPGIRGVVLAEDQTAVQILKRFAKHDGVSAARIFTAPTADTPSTPGDLWVYDSAIGCYGLVDAASFTYTNDVSKLEVLVNSAPKVFFFVRPSAVGTENAAAFTDLQKLIDDDPTNYVASTSTDYKWAFECPDVPMIAQVKSVSVIVDVDNAHATKSRKVRFGLFNPYDAVGTNGYLDAVATDVTIPAGTSRSVQFMVLRYVQYNFRNAVYTGGAGDPNASCQADFQAGRFLAKNASTAVQHLQMKAEVIDLGGGNAGTDQVHLHGMALMVEVLYPQVPKKMSPAWRGPGWGDYYTPDGRWKKPRGKRKRHRPGDPGFGDLSDTNGRGTLQVMKELSEQLEGTDFFARGEFQADDGSGKYTGTPGGAITKPCDVARHIVEAVAGLPVNATSGTLGNFVDARSTGILSTINDTLISFGGPNEVHAGEALDVLTDRFPMDIHIEDGTARCFPDDMNPDSSRNYLSISEDGWIGPADIDVDDFEVERLGWSDIQNSVLFKYSHGYPDRPAAASYIYENPLSQSYFGKLEQLVVEEPFVVQQNMTTPVVSTAQTMAEWYGRRAARPRLTVTASLTQKFYKLQVGHVTEFRYLEDLGIKPSGFRNQQLDYYLRVATDHTNYRDTAAFKLIADSGTGRLYIGLSRQTDRFYLPIAVPAAYTTVGAGDGSTAWIYSAIGGAFNALTGVQNGNAPKAGAGLQLVSFTRPRPDLWYKQELTIDGEKYGPCYWIAMDYQSATASGTGSARPYLPNVWAGRRFAVKRFLHDIGGRGSYPRRRVVLREVI